MKPDKNKNSNPQPSDASGLQDEAFVKQRLESLGQPGPIDPYFVQQLSDRLDKEFAKSVIGIQTDAETELDFNDEDRWTTRPSKSIDNVNAPKRTRKLPRWIGGLVAACVFVGMISLWSYQPQTSWAEMIEALRATPWVQTDSGRTSSWFSASNQIAARRDTNQTVFVSRNSGTRYNYVSEDQRIYQTSAADTWQPLESDLIAWLARSSNGSIDPDADWSIRSESAKYIDEASGRWLKLTVVFESGTAVDRVFTAVFTLDPESKLPVSCQVLDGDLVADTASSDWRSVSFDYPSKGPADIFELGVATGTPIVLSSSDSNIGLVGSSAQPALEINRVAKLTPKKLGPSPVEPKAVEPKIQPQEQPPSVPKPNDIAEAPVDKSSAKQTPDWTEPKTTATPSAVEIVPIPDTSVAMTSRVDELVEELWAKNDVVPVDPTKDEAFLRRVYLDVIGRVPTTNEYDRFFELDADTRRSTLIDKLLASREHALHMGGIWKRVLVPDDETAISRLGGSGKLEQWLSDSFAKHQPYDELVRELLLAEGRVNESGPLLFYAAAKMNAEELAARTSRTFLGMRMECAECHDHPFDHWSQEDFWGLAAYFAQISRPQGKIEMVSPVLRVHDADYGDVKLPETETVIDPKLPLVQHGGHGMTQSDIDALKKAEVTDGSRREQLAAWITHPQNSHFSQATVNRIWAHLFGVGLVNPVDDMGSHNTPVSPQLLNQLGRYFAKSDFDIQGLMRVLLNSRAYQLSSENREEESKHIMFFTRMPLKPLTAEQLYDCLATATGRADLGRQTRQTMPLAFTANVDRFFDPGRAAFLAQFRTSIDQRTDYQAGIPQALTLMNGPMITSATADAPKGILRSLSAPFFDDQTRIEKLFVATLSRKPTEEEQKRYAEFLSSQPDGAEKSETLGDVLWVLLNSTEFTMNH